MALIAVRILHVAIYFKTLCSIDCKKSSNLKSEESNKLDISEDFSSHQQLYSNPLNLVSLEVFGYSLSKSKP